MFDTGRVLLGKAAGDLKAIQHMQDTFTFDEHVFGFLAQQACEKALKAWLLHTGGESPFIHDLRKLMTMLAVAGQEVAEADAIHALTVYAVGLRYDEAPPADLLDRPATVALCEGLFNHVVELTGYDPEKR